MYKVLLTIKLQPGTREKILKAAPEVQKETRAEEGCISYDFFTCTDDPDRLAFIGMVYIQRGVRVALRTRSYKKVQSIS